MNGAQNAINGNVTTAAADDSNVNIAVTDTSTTITAAKLSLITAGTTGSVTLNNSHSITGTAAEVEAALITDAVTAAAGTTATVSDGLNAADAAALAGVNNVEVAYTTGISDSLANLLNGAGNAINGNVTTAAGDDPNVNIAITDNSTTITAAKLSLITAGTTGTVTLNNSHSITGTGAQLKAALETDAVTAAAGTTATVSDAVSISVANSIAGATNVTAAFTNGISDTLGNLATSGTAESGANYSCYR